MWREKITHKRNVGCLHSKFPAQSREASPGKAVRRMKSDAVCEFTLQLLPHISGIAFLAMGRQDTDTLLCVLRKT